MEKSKKILVIDAHAMAYRGHFALERQNLTNASGQSTGAIFGFFRMFFKILTDFEPEETLVAWDPPGKGFRDKIYKDYKATRNPMPDDLRSQIVEIKEIVRNMGFATSEVPGFEADDVMGTMAARFGKKHQVYLLTSDKDCFQLINKNVRMLKGAKGVTEFTMVDEEWVEKEIGVLPSQIPDYMALVGDSSDNIPGAKGIGPKTASELIRENKSIEKLYKNIGKIAREGTRLKLQEAEKLVYLSKDLATIRTDVPEVLELPEDKMKTPDFLAENVIQFFRTEGYRAISDELRRAADRRAKKKGIPINRPQTDDESRPSEGDSPQTKSDFARPGNSRVAESTTATGKGAGSTSGAKSKTPAKKSRGKQDEESDLFDEVDVEETEPEVELRSGKDFFDPKKVNYTIIKDLSVLKAAIAEHSKRSIVCVDTETDASDPMLARLVGISLSSEAKVAQYIPIPPVDSPHFGAGLTIEEVTPILSEFFQLKNVSFVGQNIKYDFTVLRRHGMLIRNIGFDTMLGGYLLNPNVRRHNLDDLALDYLDYSTIHYDDVVGTGRKRTTMDQLPPDKIRDYACEDADITLQLSAALQAKLKEVNLYKIAHELDIPLIPALADMEYAGVSIDLDYFAELSRDYKKRIATLEKQVYDEVGQVFNLNSTKELQFILLEKLRLPMGKKIKTGFSTDQRELERMRGLHPMIDHLLEYRKYTKLLSTYVDSLPLIVHPETGKIHTTMHQAVAATGRLSSMDPNLQNIPVREEQGRAIRRGFIASKDRELLSLDYSQVELRIMAHYSKDPSLMEAFTRSDVDIHSRTASSIFGVEESAVTSDMRSKAKVVNFSIIYGVTDFGLGQSLQIPRAEAKTYIEKFFEKYPGVKRYMDDTIEFAGKNGYVETLFGRRRQIADIRSPNRFRREGAERTAINTPIQGTSADLIKRAMIDIHAEMKGKRMQSDMILQVHDELLFDVVPTEKDAVLAIAKKHMEDANLRVPLRVDAGFGKNWDETKG
ncbi:MAG: DNA polymerase I [Leptospirales bacterium]|nr:DNA polymerase I [Leptospirales bacterium]